MRRMFALALVAIFAAGCNCPYLGPCAPVDHEGWTTFFSGWGAGCDDCCPYGGCYSGSYSGPPANPRGLYRHLDEPGVLPNADGTLPDGTAPEGMTPEGMPPEGTASGTDMSFDSDIVPPPPINSAAIPQLLR